MHYLLKHWKFQPGYGRIVRGFLFLANFIALSALRSDVEQDPEKCPLTCRSSIAWEAKRAPQPATIQQYGLSPRWVTICRSSHVSKHDGLLYTLQPFHRQTKDCSSALTSLSSENCNWVATCFIRMCSSNMSLAISQPHLFHLHWTNAEQTTPADDNVELDPTVTAYLHCFLFADGWDLSIKWWGDSCWRLSWGNLLLVYDTLLSQPSLSTDAFSDSAAISREEGTKFLTRLQSLHPWCDLQCSRETTEPLLEPEGNWGILSTLVGNRFWKPLRCRTTKPLFMYWFSSAIRATLHLSVWSSEPLVRWRLVTFMAFTSLACWQHTYKMFFSNTISLLCHHYKILNNQF